MFCLLSEFGALGLRHGLEAETLQSCFADSTAEPSER